MFGSWLTLTPFSSPEAAPLLVSDLWPCPTTISFPESSFPLTSGRKTRTLLATISGMRRRCRLRSETGWAEFGYFLCYFKMVAPRALVSRPLVKGNKDSGNEIGSNNGSPRFTDFPSLCACSESSLTNLIGSGFNLLCLQIHSKPECRWTWSEVAILGADQKERGLWGRECANPGLSFSSMQMFFAAFCLDNEKQDAASKKA